MLIYPFAILISPVLGLVSSCSENGMLTRHFALWNLLSMLNSISLLGVSAYYLLSQNIFHEELPLSSLWIWLMPPAIILIKISTAQWVNTFIASAEVRRMRRGWSGMITTRRGYDLRSRKSIFAEWL